MNPTHDSAVPVERRGRWSRLTVWVDPARRLARRRPRLTVAVLVVVVVLVGVGVRAWAAPDPEAPGWAHSPRSAVQGYLDALADGRAADALAYLSRPPADRAFLTDAVLARSRELAPMTQIVVVKAAGRDCRYDCEVRAEYRLGDDKMKVTFEVRQDDGYWFVDTRLQTVRLTGYRDYDQIGGYQVPVLVNGTPTVLGGDEVVMFPGRYQARSGHPLVEIDTTFTVGLAELRYDDLAVRLRPALTADGERRVAEAAQDRLDTCLAQTSFDTGCAFLDYDTTGFDGPADPTTITWTLTDDATMPQPGGQLLEQYGPAAGLAVAVPVDIQPRCTWTTVAGQAMQWEPHMAPNGYVADLTDPDHITVTFAHY